MTFPVDWEDNVTTDQEPRTRDLHSRNGDVYFIIHHSVTLRVQDTIATFWSDREVSANFAIGPLNAGGDDIKVVRTVPENQRAWTTASSLDDRALTTEVCDQALGGNYPVSSKAKEKLAQIVAYMNREYGMPIDRAHVLSHQEAYARGYGSYATACPGPDLQASLDQIVVRARDIASGVKPQPPKGDNEMPIIVQVKDVPSKPLYAVSPGAIAHQTGDEAGVAIAAFKQDGGAQQLSTAQFNQLLHTLQIPVQQVYHFGGHPIGYSWSRENDNAVAMAAIKAKLGA